MGEAEAAVVVFACCSEVLRFNQQAAICAN
jgi:hypothetical protein